jgi:hypothetical protein
MRSAILAILILTFGVAPLARASDDKAAIRAIVLDYIEGYYLSDPVRMERSLHPTYLKHTVSGSGGDVKIVEKRGVDMVQEVRNKKDVTPVADRKQDITILDVSGDVASVKLVATAWTNYMTLLKQNSAWKILSVVKRDQE